MQHQSSTAYSKAFQPVFEQLCLLTQTALQRCILSLLEHPESHALFIHCPSDECLRLLQHSQLIEIAWALQQACGRTQIYLYHAQRSLLMQWDSQQLSRSFHSS